MSLFNVIPTLKERPVLTYLDIKGFAESIRLALIIGHVDFEDRRVTYEDISQMRNDGELPFGQVPVLDVGKKRYGQSGAILRWAGQMSGLYPANQQFEIDMALEGIVDIHKCLVPAWYGHACGRSPVTGTLYETTKLSHSQMEGVFAALNSELLPARFQQLEKLVIDSGGPYICGTALSIADLSLYVLVQGLRDGSFCTGISTSVVDSCSHLLNLVSQIQSIPEVVAWENRRYT